MKKVNKILVACDLSNYSIQAVEYAAEMAESVNAELVIVNVINQRDLDMIEKVTRHTDKITVSKYVSETREYRSEEIAKVLADLQTRSGSIQDDFQDRRPVPGDSGGNRGRKSGHSRYGDKRPDRFGRRSFRLHRRKNVPPMPHSVVEHSHENQ
jgi:hypothetical protein